MRTGWLGDADLRAVVASSAGLVLPSLDEGFGLPVLEALACGRPVLASDLPVLREVAGDHALFAPPDEEAIADGLARLAATADGDREQAARRAWASRFTWEDTADQTLATYRAARAERT